MKLKYLLIGLSSVFGIFAVYAAFALLAFGGVSNAGIFGDMFGGLNALFASIATIGVVIAIFLQREQILMQKQELVLQREELKLQREEMNKSRAELAEQARVQNNSLKVSLTKLHLSALDAENLADQMESARAAPDSRSPWISKIRGRAGTMRDLIVELETKMD